MTLKAEDVTCIGIKPEIVNSPVHDPIASDLEAENQRLREQLAAIQGQGQPN